MAGMNKIKTLCVYCGSGPGTNPRFIEAAIALGKVLAENGIRLVYGGGSIGLMGALATSVLDHGGAVTGIIPDFLTSREHALTRVQEMIVTPDMHERKRLMFERSDAFVALPGGIGTLEELVTGFSRDRSVLVVDSFEGLEPISGWVRDTLLPALPSQVAVILAGRLAPDTRWTAHQLWCDAMRSIGLDSLSRVDSARLLEVHGVAADAHSGVLDLCHGQPLARHRPAARGAIKTWGENPPDPQVRCCARLRRSSRYSRPRRIKATNAAWSWDNTEVRRRSTALDRASRDSAP